jgi:hypothetical protein
MKLSDVVKEHKQEVEAAYAEYVAMGMPKNLAKRRAVRDVENMLIDEDYDKRDAGLPSNGWYF